MQCSLTETWSVSNVKDIKYTKTQIRDYVKDHYKYYGFYPYDVEVDNILYSYEQYMDILSMTV